MHHIVDDLCKLQARKPGCEDVSADSGLDASADTVPEFALGLAGIGVSHDRCFAFVDRACRWGIGLNPILPASGRLSYHSSKPHIWPIGPQSPIGFCLCPGCSVLPTQPRLRPCARSCGHTFIVRWLDPAVWCLFDCYEPDRYRSMVLQL
eukprot:GHVR01040633.1.p1 GENE.GHVR01040633.1~~GHVR01040633.1.p1  ORF type:complete len:150 (+),score=4.15 GHVR01040633.1:1-450(+)